MDDNQESRSQSICCLFFNLFHFSLDNPLQQQAETMLSSEKLAVAVQLAKMDIRKLKTMLSSNDQGITVIVTCNIELLYFTMNLSVVTNVK